MICLKKGVCGIIIIVFVCLEALVMSKTKKILIGILVVVVLIVSGLGVGYAIAPREFLQLFLSDGAYTKVMLAKNFSKMYPLAEDIAAKVDDKKFAFEAEGTVNAKFNNKIIDKSIATELSNYVSTLNMKSDLNLEGALLNFNASLYDNSGEVLSSSVIVDPMSVYLNIKQLEFGWMNVDKKDDETQHSVGVVNETYETIIKEKVDDDLKKAIYNYMKIVTSTFESDKISISKEKDFQLGSAVANGEVVTVSMSAADLINCVDTVLVEVKSDENTFTIINNCLPESEKMTFADFKNKLDILRDKLVKKINDSEIETVNLDFFVDSRNEITALEVNMNSNKATNIVSIIIEDSNDAGYVLSVKANNETTLLIDVKKLTENSGVVSLEKKMADGTLSVKVRYSDFSVTDNGIFGKFDTDPFVLPGYPELGEIALDVDISNSEKGIKVSADITVENLGDFNFILDMNESESKIIKLPLANEISAFDSDKFKTELINYFMIDLPQTDSQYRGVYQKVVGSVFEDAISSLWSSIFGNTLDGDSLGKGINSIIQSAQNKDSSAVVGIVDDFLSAFGLKGN